MYNVAIIGASGYTGGELLRMLLNHPEVEITDVTSRQYDGTPVHKIHPHIRDSGLEFVNKQPDELDADVVFTATPHGASMKIVPIAIKEYYINNTPIEQTIRNHTNIYDFCLRLKVNSAATLLFNPNTKPPIIVDPLLLVPGIKDSNWKHPTPAACLYVMSFSSLVVIPGLI